MANSGWQKFFTFINGKELGHIFTRQEYILCAKLNQLKHGTVDMWRNQLVHAGMWKRVAPGTYELQQKLPAGTTTTELFALYQHQRLEYLELVTARKEREFKRGL